MRDEIIRATLANGAASLAIASTRDMVECARKIHDTSAVATAALGRTLTMTSIISLSLKGAGDTVTITLDGAGPLGKIVAGGRAPALVKGYVEHPEVELPPNAVGKLDVLGALGSKGMLTVIRDLGLKEPYVGRSHIMSGEIAEDFAYYFTVSEQTPSLVALGVTVGRDLAVASAGGILIQALPDCPDDVISSLEEKAGRMSKISSLTAEFDELEALVNDLFGELDPVILEKLTPKFCCDCSRERIERALIAMGHDELAALRDEDGGAELGCSFCGSKYLFTYDDLDRLIKSSEA